DGRIARVLDVGESLPAIGQGALAVEARADDAATRARLARLHHPPTERATAAERAFLGRLDGSCRTPLAAHAVLHGERLRVAGLVGRTDGSEILRDAVERAAADAERLGVQLAERLLARGADAILRACAAQTPVGGA